MTGPFDQITRQLMRDEGSSIRHGRHLPYVDTVGKTTIGYGRNLTDRGLSEDETRLMLENDIVGCIGELASTFPWFEKLDEPRQGAMVNLCFNLGLTKLLKFPVFLSYMKIGNWEQAAVSLLQSRYAEQVGNRALRVSEQIRRGEWI